MLIFVEATKNMMMLYLVHNSVFMYGVLLLLKFASFRECIV